MFNNLNTILVEHSEQITYNTFILSPNLSLQKFYKTYPRIRVDSRTSSTNRDISIILLVQYVAINESTVTVTRLVLSNVSMQLSHVCTTISVNKPNSRFHSILYHLPITSSAL